MQRKHHDMESIIISNRIFSGDCARNITFIRCHALYLDSISGSDVSQQSPHLRLQPLPIRRQPVGGVAVVPKGLKTMLGHLVLSLGRKSLQTADTHK